MNVGHQKGLNKGIKWVSSRAVDQITENARLPEDVWTYEWEELVNQMIL